MSENREPSPGGPSGGPDATTPAKARNEVEHEVHRLREENEQLRADLAQAQVARDDYLEILRKVAPEYAITQADLDRAVPSGPWLDELIAQLERGDAA